MRWRKRQRPSPRSIRSPSSPPRQRRSITASRKRSSSAPIACSWPTTASPAKSARSSRISPRRSECRKSIFARSSKTSPTSSRDRASPGPTEAGRLAPPSAAGLRCRQTSPDRRADGATGMIISHEHKFIFLKTRKTAGTSVELALRQLCGPDDIIAPIGEAEERRQQALHYQGRPPQNWRVHGWWQSPRPLFKRYWFRFSPGDYGFYNHIPAREARALLNDDKVWRSYFKFAFERNPWDRQVSAAAPGSTITKSI